MYLIKYIEIILFDLKFILEILILVLHILEYMFSSIFG